MKYQLLEHVSFTQVDDEAVLLDLNTGTYFGLNNVGTHFINVIENTAATDHLQQATNEIAGLYKTDEQQVRSDLLELIEQLKKNILLSEIP